jgi:hypothetical protein
MRFGALLHDQRFPEIRTAQRRLRQNADKTPEFVHWQADGHRSAFCEAARPKNHQSVL